MPLIPFVRMSTRSSNLLSRSSAMCAAALTLAFSAACLNAGAQTTTPTHPPYVYTITNLGIEGYAINESGDVAGVFPTSTGAAHAALYKAGKVIDLGVVPGASASIAYGVNGYDQVTGEVDFPGTSNTDPYSHAFLYSAGTMKDIGTIQFPGAPFDIEEAAGTAINDSGQIAGASTVFSPVFDPLAPNPTVFLYSAGKLTPIFNLYDAVAGGPGFDPVKNGLGNNINAAGQIAAADGIYNSSDGSITAGPFQASAINDSGDLTGGDNYAFLYSKGVVTDIVPPPHAGPYSYGADINAADEIIGVEGQALGDPGTPFLWAPGQGFISLNFVPGSDLSLIGYYSAINDKGQIVAGGALLSPVFQSFSTLNTVAGIIGTPGTTFAGGGRFVLGAKSNGIYLLAETTVLQLGGYHISIPPGSFVNTNGVYFYQGKIGNATVYAAIRPLGSNAYLIGVVGEGVTGLPTSYPYNLTVTIGDDTGTQAITSNYDISNLTEAEVCRDFGLPCGQ